MAGGDSKREVLLATTNPAKEERLRWLLEGLPVSPLTSESIIEPPSVAEVSETHLANAKAKALAWSQASGLPAIASDGGLVIPALGTAWDPLRTSRFAGEGAGDQERLAQLLRLMAPYRGLEREAYWAEALAVARDGRIEFSAQKESAPGRVAESYDPMGIIQGFWAFSLWYLPPLGLTYAQLTQEERDALDDHWGRLKGDLHEAYRRGLLWQGHGPS